jgi:hypothetical protein
MTLAVQQGASFDGADQGLLNAYFSDYARTGSATHRLPFLYNVAFAGTYSHVPALRHYQANIKGIHFLGAANKPWQARTMSAQGHQWVTANGVVSESLSQYLTAWWALYARAIKAKVEPLGGLSAFGIYGGRANDTYCTSSETSPTPAASSCVGGHTSDLQARSDPPPQQAFPSSYRVQWGETVEKYFGKSKQAQGVGAKVKALNRSEDESEETGTRPYLKK